jgi:peptide/nickel transport system substrate-binding protein
MKKRFWLALSLFVISTMVLAACGPGATTVAPQPTSAPATTAPQATEPPATQAATTAPTEAPTEAAAAFEGTATITYVQEPNNLNPFYTTQWFSGITRDFYLKGLWSFDQQSNPVPEIAAEIPSLENGGVSEDGKTITIKLRDDVVWSDGEPVTAADFVFTYEMIVNESNTVEGRYPYDTFVESVEAPDDHTLVVNFTEPFAPWLTSIFNYVLPQHVLQPVFDAEGTLDEAEWNRAPTVGVGPFVFQEWESASHIIFTANPNWIRPPKLEQIFIRIVDDAAQEAAILAGDSDIATFLDWSQSETINNSGVAQFVTQPAGFDEGWYLNFNPETAHPAMLDVNVRKAIVLATDREKITQDLLGGLTEPPATFWDSTPPYGNPDLEPYPYDPEEAMRLLDEAGWTDSDGDGIRDKVIDGEKVDLRLRYITTTRQLRMDVQAVVQQMWEAVGIEADLQNYDSTIFFAGYADDGPQALGEYDIAEYSNASSFPDPDTSIWLCDQIVSAENPDGSNQQGYCNPELDELFKQQAVTTNVEERVEIFHQIGQIMYDDVVWVGLWKDPDLWSVSNRLQGVTLSGPTPFWNAHEWSIQA